MGKKIRPAATVILMDKKNRVYLTQRPYTMKFLAGYYVFPGGALEKSDYLTSKQIIQTDTEETIDHAYFVGAARELFEEVGIFLGKNGNGDFAQIDHEKIAQYRQQLVNREISFLDILEKENCYLYTECLKYIAHFITPPTQPVRFDTRFFLTIVPDGQIPSPDAHEVEKGMWVTPEEALEGYNTGQLQMVAPTVLSLHKILALTE